MSGKVKTITGLIKPGMTQQRREIKTLKIQIDDSRGRSREEVVTKES